MGGVYRLFYGSDIVQNMNARVRLGRLVRRGRRFDRYIKHLAVSYGTFFTINIKLVVLGEGMLACPAGPSLQSQSFENL